MEKLLRATMVSAGKSVGAVVPTGKLIVAAVTMGKIIPTQAFLSKNHFFKKNLLLLKLVFFPLFLLDYYKMEKF